MVAGPASSANGSSSLGGMNRAELLRVLNRGDELSTVDEIIASVGAEIIEGRLRPGDDLNSVELARTFGTSRTPVREALLTLEREGFVEIAARRRPRVAPVRLGEVREMYRVRAHLYTLVSREFVEVARRSDLNRLLQLQHQLARCVELDDVAGFFWTNVRFRNAEIAATGNSTLRRLLDSLGLRMLQLRHLSLSQPGRIRESLVDHERLLQAYADRDAGLAAALTSSLVMRGLAAVERAGWADAPGSVGTATL